MGLARHHAAPWAHIRPATLSDAALVASVLHQAFAEYRALYTDRAFATTVSNELEIGRRLAEGPTWVAVWQNAIVGTVSAVLREGGVYMRSMAVLPEARGQSIGERLLGQVAAYARAHGRTQLRLSTTPFLDRAIRLYERYGFERSAEGPHDLFGTPLFTMVWMVGDGEERGGERR